MVVELQILVGVALLEVAVKRVGLHHSLGLCRLQGAVVAAEALAVHIVVVVSTVVRHAKGSIIILNGLQLLTIFNIVVNRYRVGLAAGVLYAPRVGAVGREVADFRDDALAAYVDVLGVASALVGNEIRTHVE